MSSDGIEFFQYEDHHQLVYKKSFVSLARYWYPLVWSLALLMVNYSPLIAIDFHIAIRFGVLHLDYVFFRRFCHMGTL